MTRDVDPPGADTAALLQRTGLTLAGGRVVFGFGGNDGDCATYRGRVWPSPKRAGARHVHRRRRGRPVAGRGLDGRGRPGGGRPAVTSGSASGTVRSTRPRAAYDNSDSVLDLSPSMRLLQFFAPADWAADNSRDLDMSAEPVLLPGGQVMLAGKSPTAYLLNGAHLGGIGGQLASLASACNGDIDGGAAVRAAPCTCPVSAGSWPSPRRRHHRASGCCGGPGPAAARPSWPAAWSGRSA